MSTFKLTGHVTISVYTEVAANTLVEAIEIAEDRELMAIITDGSYNVAEVWMADELDGMVTEITKSDD